MSRDGNAAWQWAKRNTSYGLTDTYLRYPEILAKLGLDPDTSEGAPGRGGVTTYWGVADADAAFARLLGLGAREHSPVREVGEGIKVAAVLDPFGNVFGIIENPHFKIEGPALPSP